MDVVISPNMGLPVPIVGQETGPAWAQDINACLGVLDQHDHSSGKGVQITPSGLNINAALTFQGNSATSLKTAAFSSQGASLAGNLGSLYVVGNELYFNDGAGNVVPITLSGSVNAGAGSITGLPSGTASASYSAGTFTWRSATNTPANMDGGSVVFREVAASAKGVTVSSPTSLAADYGLVWPLLPASTSFVTLDTSGNFGTLTQNHGITAAMIATDAGLNPAGAMVMYGGTSAPSGFLLCDGTSYLRADYATLFAAIGTAYGAADGSHFNVPDMRGMFPRGVTGAASNDPDASSRTAQATGGNTGNNVGSIQGSAFQDHTHLEKYSFTGGGSSGIQAVGGGAVFANSNVPTQGANTGTTSTETRPINVYVNFIIKT